MPYGMKVRVLSQVIILVQWCNWETRQIKVLMPRGMRVRFSPEPDNVSLAELVYAAASKAVPVRGMSSTLIRNIKTWVDSLAG